MNGSTTHIQITDDADGITMSSREIAKLCGKRHDHVIRDIKRMLAEIGGPKFGASSFEAEYTTPQNKRAKEYRLPRDLTLTLVSGYRADLRYRIIKRLEELDGLAAPRVTQVRAHTRRVSAPPMDRAVPALNTAPLPPSSPRDLLRAELQRHARAIVALMHDSAPDGLNDIRSAFITVRGDKVEVGGTAFPEGEWRAGDLSASLTPEYRWLINVAAGPRALIGGGK